MTNIHCLWNGNSGRIALGSKPPPWSTLSWQLTSAGKPKHSDTTLKITTQPWWPTGVITDAVLSTPAPPTTHYACVSTVLLLYWLNICCLLLMVTFQDIHYKDLIMSHMASQIASVSIVCSIVGSGANQRKRQSSASLALVDRWIPHTKASDAENASIWWRLHDKRNHF